MDFPAVDDAGNVGMEPTGKPTGPGPRWSGGPRFSNAVWSEPMGAESAGSAMAQRI